MKRLVRSVVFGAALVFVEGAAVAPARADLLNLQRWVTHDGGWVDPGTWLAGDFNRDGLTDLAYVFAICNSDCSTDMGIDVHLSCGRDPAAVCPAGVPNANQWGAFATHQRWFTENPSSTSINGSNCGTFLTCDSPRNGEQWLAGDFDGDGYTDLVRASGWSGLIDLRAFISSGSSFIDTGDVEDGLQGGWVDPSMWVAGDFDHDGRDELAYVFALGGDIYIDLHRFDLSTYQFDLGPERWVSNQGGWVGGGTFLAGDYNGDGATDIGYAFPDPNSNDIDLDVHLSCQSGTPPSGCGSVATNTFTLQHWATKQGGWVNPGSWASTPGVLGGYNSTAATAFSMVSDLYSLQTWDPQAGYADLMFAFEDGNSNISIDGHLAVNSPTLSGADGYFSLYHYASGQGSWPGNGVAFLTGDFNGDSIGDVADPYNDSGQINIDVHVGNCYGGVTDTGQCCAAPQQVCYGACFSSATACVSIPR